MKLISKNKVLFFFCLFLISFTIRFYKLPEYLFFGFEQGRDAQVVRNIYTFKKFPLTGPKTDIGGIFHGPIYYYLMAMPFWFSAGNPVFASLFLVLLSSLVPIIMYIFLKDLLRSEFYGLVGASISVLSYELIIYARWLSNVTLAVPFVALAYYLLWKYNKLKKNGYFLLSVVFASLACQFEIILVLEFIFSYIILLLLKIIPIPTLKTITKSFILIITIFSPLIIFDIRHDHITLNTILSLITESLNNSNHFSAINAFYAYQLKFVEMISRTLFNIKNTIFQILSLLLICFGVYKSIKEDGNRKHIYFLMVWGFMSLSILPVGAALDQSYVGSGLAWIGLFIISFRSLWKNKLTKIISMILIFVLLLGWVKNAINLFNNKDVFFTTIQDDLNFADQQKVLENIHRDANGESYRLEAFTIPSLHPEGWFYLHQYFYPNDSSNNSKLIYIIIEKHVYPIWEQKWISDLGDAVLVSEEYVGLLRVQKRIVQ